jgi:hypothetical protein
LFESEKPDAFVVLEILMKVCVLFQPRKDIFQFFIWKLVIAVLTKEFLRRN